MITIDQILGFARDAINTDAAIASWIGTNYTGRTLKVFVGIDLSDPPSENDAPFVVLSASPSDYEVGEMSDTREPVFEVDFALLDTAKSTSGNVTTYAGQTNICALAELIRAALVSMFTLDRFMSCKLSFVGVAPLWQGGMTVTLHYTQGLTEVSVAVGQRGWAEMSTQTPPPQVSTFTASVQSATRIDLSWTVAFTPRQYQIEQAPDVAGVPGTWVGIKTIVPPSTAASITGLTTATKYWFRIKCVSEGGVSDQVRVSATTS